jgi:pyridoxal phosphate enzyme (YggS family)
VTRVVTAEVVADNLRTIKERIEHAGGDPERITILAVSKTFDASCVEAACDVGLRRFGENYAAELVAKAAVVDRSGLEWHFLGAIQTNKLARLAPVTACYQGVARAKELQALARRAPEAGVMVEVELTGLPGRHGVPPAETAGLVALARALGLPIRGLMTVAPRDPTAARAAFRELGRLADQLDLPERSMGMSDDLELAVEEGSTMLRIGRALFGPRELQT